MFDVKIDLLYFILQITMLQSKNRCFMHDFLTYTYGMIYAYIYAPNAFVLQMLVIDSTYMLAGQKLT